jgi:hypothetical protein
MKSFFEKVEVLPFRQKTEDVEYYHRMNSVVMKIWLFKP